MFNNRWFSVNFNKKYLIFPFCVGFYGTWNTENQFDVWNQIIPKKLQSIGKVENHFQNYMRIKSAIFV